MRPVDTLVVHCTATPEGRPHTVADIRSWHKAKGWSDIGYHYVIYLDGSVHPGRPVEKIGAHVVGHNTGSIGIVYVGGTDAKGRSKDTRTVAQKASLRKLLMELASKYKVKRILGHHDLFAGKDCPCFAAKAEYADILKGSK